MLSEKTAIITGASGGIGMACVELFCQNHAEIYAFVRKNNTDFSNRIDELNDNGGKIHVIECDICCEEDIKIAVKELTKQTKRIDILINNAGTVGESSSFYMTPIDKMKRIFDVNFYGQTILTQYISRIMVKKSNGSIVNVSSVAAIDGTPGQYEYSSSKAAVIGATKQLAIELGSYGIRVNAVAPGITDTKMAKNISDDLYRNTLQRTVMKRAADPTEIANAILFLASDLSSYITGQILRVDGGMI